MGSFVVGGGLMGGRCSELDDVVWSMMFGVEYDGGVVAMWRGSKMASLLRCGEGVRWRRCCGVDEGVRWRGGAVVE